MKKSIMLLILFSYCSFLAPKVQGSGGTEVIPDSEPKWTVFVENATGEYIVDVAIAVKFTSGKIETKNIRDLEVIAKKRHSFKPMCCVESITVSATAKKLFGTKEIKSKTWKVKDDNIPPGEIGIKFNGTYAAPGFSFWRSY